MKPKFDPLFKSGADIDTQACVSQYGGHNLNLFATGYKEAADQLINYMCKSASSRDTLVFPIIFLYRHYLELRFKDIIVIGTKLLDKNEKYPDGHKLKDLWPRAKGIARQVWKDSGEPPEFALIDHIVQEFLKFDPESDAFRYPTDKTGKKMSLRGITHINLRHVGEQINKVAGVLDAISLGLCEYLDYKREMEAEYR